MVVAKGHTYLRKSSTKAFSKCVCPFVTSNFKGLKNTSKICLKEIFGTRNIVRWGYPNCPLRYRRYKQAFIVFQWLFCNLPIHLVFIIWGGYICVWFLPHLFCCHDLFTFVKFCACVVDKFSVSNESVLWQLLERQREIMVSSSARREIYLQIDS